MKARLPDHNPSGYKIKIIRKRIKNTCSRSLTPTSGLCLLNTSREQRWIHVITRVRRGCWLPNHKLLERDSGCCDLEECRSRVLVRRVEQSIAGHVFSSCLRVELQAITFIRKLDYRDENSTHLEIVPVDKAADGAIDCQVTSCRPQIRREPGCRCWVSEALGHNLCR
jgi:hypothetical protein